MSFSDALWRFQVVRRLPDDVFSANKIIERNTGGTGNSRTKLVTFKDAIQLVMVLPGQVAKETRAQFAGIIERYMAGDGSLHAEIEANAGSNAPIAQLARESLVLDQHALGMKRKREELELLRMEHEITGLAIENKAKEQARILAAAAELERIRDPARSNLDDRTRLMIQDSLQNSLLTSQVSGVGGQHAAVLTNGPSPNKPISIGSVAKELGYNPNSNEAKRIGLDLRKRYVAQHGRPPPKHDQLCDGRVTLVNSYTEQDRVLVEGALHAYFRASPDASDHDLE